jgi:hypothetical protein
MFTNTEEVDLYDLTYDQYPYIFKKNLKKKNTPIHDVSQQI